MLSYFKLKMRLGNYMTNMDQNNNFCSKNFCTLDNENIRLQC